MLNEEKVRITRENTNAHVASSISAHLLIGLLINVDSTPEVKARPFHCFIRLDLRGKTRLMMKARRQLAKNYLEYKELNGLTNAD